MVIHNVKQRCPHCNELFSSSQLVSHLIKLIDFDDSYQLVNDSLDSLVECKLCHLKKFNLTKHLYHTHNMEPKKYQEYFMNAKVKTENLDIKLNEIINITKVLNKPLRDKKKLNINHQRKIMNKKEKIIDSITPDNVIFSDTKFYLNGLFNGKQTNKNPDFIVIDLVYVDSFNKELEEYGHIKSPLLKSKVNKVIEHLGNYWHSEKITGVSENIHEQQYIDFYKQFNIECLVIWEHEVKDIVTLQHKINNFLKM